MGLGNPPVLLVQWKCKSADQWFIVCCVDTIASMCVCVWQGESFSHTVTAQTSSARVEGLKTGTVYTVQVRARTVAGYGSYSHPVDYSTSLHGTSLHSRMKNRFEQAYGTLDNRYAFTPHRLLICIFIWHVGVNRPLAVRQTDPRGHGKLDHALTTLTLRLQGLRCLRDVQLQLKKNKTKQYISLYNINSTRL